MKLNMRQIRQTSAPSSILRKFYTGSRCSKDSDNFALSKS